MSSKALTLAVALAGAASVALGQTASQNVVGYINVTLKKGVYSLVANQLNNGKGNKVSDLLGGVPENTVIQKFDNTKGGFDSANTFIGGEWDIPAQTLAPGEGAFIKAPADNTVTFVGEVIQGKSDVPLRKGYSMISSPVPQDIDLAKAADYSIPAANGDIVVQFVNGAYKGANTFLDGFDDGVIKVGEAFWYFNSGNAKIWSRTFNVQ